MEGRVEVMKVSTLLHTEKALCRIHQTGDVSSPHIGPRALPNTDALFGSLSSEIRSLLKYILLIHLAF